MPQQIETRRAEMSVAWMAAFAAMTGGIGIATDLLWARQDKCARCRFGDSRAGRPAPRSGVGSDNQKKINPAASSDARGVLFTFDGSPRLKPGF